MHRYLATLTVFFIATCAPCPWALSISPPPSKVVVTGASGKTGRLVFEALQNNSEFEPLALVRSEKSAKALRKLVPETGLEQVVICDVTSSTSQAETEAALEGCEAMIICTSAMPVISKWSLIKNFLKIPINLLRPKKKAFDFRALKFVWKAGQYPEKVDYEGQKAQIDLAKRLGMKHVVIVGSMGGTDPSNFLNTIGKNKDGSGNGDILLWKRKAEVYLTESKLDYTIIHPGGLKDTPAGEAEYILDVDDILLNNTQRSISRADVANLCVAALSVGKGQKVALDAITKPLEEGQEAPSKTAEEALEAFLQQNKTYHY